MTAAALFVVAIVLGAAFLRGLTGFGFALAAVPLMSLALPPATAVAVAVLLQLLVGVRDVVALRGQYDRDALLRLSAGAILGAPLGVLGLSALSADQSRVAIAAITLAGLVVILRRPVAEPRPRPALALAAGGVAGVFSGLAAMPGPPAVAYFLGTGAPAPVTRATLMMFFLVTNAVTAPGLALAHAVDRQALVLTALAFPALMLGTWAGDRAFRRLGHSQYRGLAIGVLAISALLAGWRGLA